MSEAADVDGVGPVLVTGCSTGIGRATATHLAGLGHTVYATARRLDTLDELARGGCRTIALDVTDESSMRDAVASIEGEHGRVGALVNNAGYSQSGPVEEITPASLRRQWECPPPCPPGARSGHSRAVDVAREGQGPPRPTGHETPVPPRPQ